MFYFAVVVTDVAVEAVVPSCSICCNNCCRCCGVVVVVAIDVVLFLFCFKHSKELATEEIMGSRCGTAVEYTSPNQEVTGSERTGSWTYFLSLSSQ